MFECLHPHRSSSFASSFIYPIQISLLNLLDQFASLNFFAQPQPKAEVFLRLDLPIPKSKFASTSQFPTLEPHVSTKLRYFFASTCLDLLEPHAARRTPLVKSEPKDPAFLLGMVGTYKYHGNEIYEITAHSEAIVLHDEILGKESGHEEMIPIITTRSKQQLLATFNHFKDIHGKSITKGLQDDDANDEFFAMMRPANRCIKNPQKFLRLLFFVIFENDTASKEEVEEKSIESIRRFRFSQSDMVKAGLKAEEDLRTAFEKVGDLVEVRWLRLLLV
ncbi:hypothetical protein Droror1_Dr00017625 [Drosera rotundifolia]